MDATSLGSEPSGNPSDGQSAVPAEGSTGNGASFLDGLSGDNRQVAEAKSWNDANSVFDSYRQLESKIGSSLTAPGADAPPEEWTKFHEKTGRPEKAEDYAFERPEGLHAEFPYSDEMADGFKKFAHETGLSPHQAQKLHDWYLGDANTSFSESQAGAAEAVAAVEAKLEEQHKTLTKAWGAPETEGYKRSVELTTRALDNLGLKESLIAGGQITQGEDGGLMVADANMALALHKVGEALFFEDALHGSGVDAVAGSANPFSPEHTNLTEQSRMIRTDPEKAKRYIRRAGKDPAKYSL